MTERAQRVTSRRRKRVEELEKGDEIRNPISGPGYGDYVTVRAVKPKGDGSGVLFVHQREHSLPLVMREGQEVVLR